jgi:thiol-disulfide isomerase/thioredoxin
MEGSGNQKMESRPARGIGARLVCLPILAASLAGCGRAADSPGAGNAPAPVPVAAGSSASAGDSAPGRAAGVADSAPVLAATGQEILRRVREPGAKAVLVNVWATWCVPCMEEFPHLVRLRRAYADRGLRVILVSGDFASELPRVREFLATQGVDFVSYIKSGDDVEFIDALSPRWSGALPATFIYDGGGALRQMWESRASYERFERGVLEVLNSRAARSGRKPVQATDICRGKATRGGDSGV